MRGHRIAGYLVVGTLFAMVGTARAGVTFSEDFNSGILNPNLVPSASAGFSVTLSGGQAQLDKSAGVGNGAANIATTFSLVGDFIVTVDANLIDLGANGEAGLEVFDQNAHTGFADVFFIGGGGINGNDFFSGGAGGISTVNAANPVTFAIVRSGNVISDEVDTGSGFSIVNSSTVNVGPVCAAIFDLQEFGNTAPQQTTFDNLNISAGSFANCGSTTFTAAPEPASIALFGAGLIGLGAFRRRRVLRAAVR
jgi:hypothetical protein